MRHLTRTSALVAGILAFALVGCGGDDDATPSDADTSEADAAGAGEGSGEGDADTPGGDDTATVVVGDTTYEFTIIFCQQVMGGLAGSGEVQDGSGTSLTISLPPPGEGDDLLDTPSITVDADDQRWEADATLVETFSDVAPGQSEVTYFEIDGTQASGTASFVDTYSVAGMTGDGEATEGSFELSCS